MSTEDEQKPAFDAATLAALQSVTKGLTWKLPEPDALGGEEAAQKLYEPQIFFTDDTKSVALPFLSLIQPPEPKVDEITEADIEAQMNEIAAKCLAANVPQSALHEIRKMLEGYIGASRMQIGEMKEIAKQLAEATITEAKETEHLSPEEKEKKFWEGMIKDQEKAIQTAEKAEKLGLMTPEEVQEEKEIKKEMEAISKLHDGKEKKDRTEALAKRSFNSLAAWERARDEAKERGLPIADEIEEIIENKKKADQLLVDKDKKEKASLQEDIHEDYGTDIKISPQKDGGNSVITDVVKRLARNSVNVSSPEITVSAVSDAKDLNEHDLTGLSSALPSLTAVGVKQDEELATNKPKAQDTPKSLNLDYANVADEDIELQILQVSEHVKTPGKEKDSSKSIG